MLDIMTGYRIYERYQACGAQAMGDRSRRPYRYANMPLVLLVIAVLLTTLVAGAQRRTTIPEAAARVSPGPLFQTRTAEVTDLNVAEMVASADLVLVGTLERSRVYLSKDETELYTEYRVTPTEVVVQRKADVFTSPGQHVILLRQWGGRTVIGGVEVNVIDSNLAPLPTGMPLVLLLTKASDGVYELVGASDGAFSVQGGKVHAMRAPPTGAEHYRGMPLGLFVAELGRFGVQRNK